MVATTMSSLFVAFFALIASTLRTRAALHAEILALRHQLAVFANRGHRFFHRADGDLPGPVRLRRHTEVQHSRCHLRNRLRRHDRSYGNGGKCLLRRDPPGKIPWWSGWWARSDASAWTT